MLHGKGCASADDVGKKAICCVVPSQILTHLFSYFLLAFKAPFHIGDEKGKRKRFVFCAVEQVVYYAQKKTCVMPKHVLRAYSIQSKF